jgi:hypothetical protein
VRQRPPLIGGASRPDGQAGHGYFIFALQAAAGEPDFRPCLLSLTASPGVPPLRTGLFRAGTRANFVPVEPEFALAVLEWSHFLQRTGSHFAGKCFSSAPPKRAEVRQGFLSDGFATELSRGSPGSCVVAFSLELTADHSLANVARAGPTD